MRMRVEVGVESGFFVFEPVKRQPARPMDPHYPSNLVRRPVGAQQAKV
jgi:hypothetical protein